MTPVERKLRGCLRDMEGFIDVARPMGSGQARVPITGRGAVDWSVVAWLDTGISLLDSGTRMNTQSRREWSRPLDSVAGNRQALATRSGLILADHQSVRCRARTVIAVFSCSRPAESRNQDQKAGAGSRGM